MTGSDGTDRGTDVDPSPPTSPPRLQAVPYAPPELFKRRTGAVDGIVLFFGLGQLAMAFLAGVWRVLESNGYHELSDPTWWKWLAWHAMGGQWMLWAWAGASLVAVVGASLPPGRRRRWYLIYAAAWLVGVVACVAGLATLDRVTVQERWVSTYYGTPAPQEWRTVFIDPTVYWQIPLMMTIANPLIVLFTFRLTQGRAAEGVAEQSSSR